jgi:hypothetical protein
MQRKQARTSMRQFELAGMFVNYDVIPDIALDFRDKISAA